MASGTQQSTQAIQRMMERLQTAPKNVVQAMNNGHARAQVRVAQAATAAAAIGETTRPVSTTTAMNTQIAGAADPQRVVAQASRRNVIAGGEISHQRAGG